jgi:PAS domain S-box-containing protein
MSAGHSVDTPNPVLLDHRLLLEQQERFLFATDAAQIGYWFCDLPFDKLIWDPRVKEHFWLPPEADVDINLFYERLHPEDRERTRDSIRAAIESHTRYDIEYRAVSPEGQIRWIHAIGRTAYDQQGRPVRFDGVTQDITPLRSALESRDRAEAALIRSEKLAAVGRLSATISHEINNPLEAVVNLLYLIGQSATDTQTQEYVALAQKELARVSHIVTHTLRFNRGKDAASLERIPDLLDSSVAIYEGRLRHQQISLVRDYRPDAFRHLFPSDLRQVFANLIGNAFDASKRGGRLILRARAQTHRATGENGVRITIADTGEGMDAATRARLFEPFFTTKADRGTGLGLWVSLEIVQRHRGRIRAKSRQLPCSGTVFSVWLPMQLP